MEAWIFHNREEWLEDNGKIIVINNYSVWSTKKQAWKAACDFLLHETQNWGVFFRRKELRIAVESLIKNDNYEDAVNLVNRYSSVEQPESGSLHRPRKCNITIAKTTFSGSAFE